MSAVTLKVNLASVQREFKNVERAIITEAGPQALRVFYAAWKLIVIQAWDKMRASEGGDFRGKNWPRMNDQYTRVTDGATVPWWGGVPRIRPAWLPAGLRTGNERAQGLVLGKKTSAAPFGTRSAPHYPTNPDLRGKPTSILLASGTGQLRSAFLADQINMPTPTRIIIGANTPAYAERQHKRRPLFFWAQGDGPLLKRCVTEEVRKILARRRATGYVARI